MGTTDKSHQHSSKTNAKLFFVLCGLSLVIFLSLAWVARNFTIDDTFISLRYASNLSAHGDLAWNVGEEPKAEGYTSLTWVLLMAATHWLWPEALYVLSKVVSLVFGCLSIVLTALISRQLGHSNQNHAITPALLLAISAPFLLWCVSGMETAFYIALVLTAVYLLIKEEQSDLSILSPIVLLAIALTRTEGIIVYGAIVLLRTIFYISWQDKRYSWKRPLYQRWNMIFVIPFFLYLGWKYLYYGGIFPLPAYIKSAAGLEGISYVKNFLVFNTPYILLILIYLIKEKLRRELLYLIAVLCTILLAFCFSNPIMGWHFRLVLVTLPLIYILATLEVAKLMDASKSLSKKAVLCGLLVFLFVPQIQHPTHYIKTLKSESYVSLLTNVHIALGQWLKAQADYDPESLIALGDAGAIAFYSKMHCLDFYGLNDVLIAKTGFTPESVLHRHPQYMILKSDNNSEFQGTLSRYGKFSQAIYQHPEFQSDYVKVQIFSNPDPFYSLWVFKNITTDKQTQEPALHYKPNSIPSLFTSVSTLGK